MKKRRGPRPIDLMKVSPIYREIVMSKHNGKVLPNGDVRVGDDMVSEYKTGLIKKYIATNYE